VAQCNGLQNRKIAGSNPARTSTIYPINYPDILKHMSNTNQQYSEIELFKLEQLVDTISHLYIGDHLPYTQDKEKLEEIHNERNQLWLDAIVNSGPFEKRAYWLRRELEASYKFFRFAHNNYPNVDTFSFGLFCVSFTADKLASELITHLAIALSIKTNSKDYSGNAKKILVTLGYKGGLLDENLRQLNFKETLRKVLTTTDLWDPDMDNEKK
jgi:hypothetical protein